ncbi:hypothetical protein [Simkania sp.]|uniref:hypothetical protein n=1 Tax=Simkania sp. TaxID=34094 RepID=UPI003B51D512
MEVVYCSGDLVVRNNTINLIGERAFGVSVLSTAPDANYFIDNNMFDATFSTSTETTAIALGTGRTLLPFGPTVENFGTLSITNNQIIGDPSGNSIRHASGGWGLAGPGLLIFENNTIKNASANNAWNTRVAFRVWESPETLFIKVIDNTWSGTTDLTSPAALITNLRSGANVCVELIGNKSPYDPAYYLNNFVGGVFGYTSNTTSANNNGETIEFFPSMADFYICTQ